MWINSKDAKVYIIPRKNATLRGSWKWKNTMEEFVINTLSYLEQYYLRNNSESGFSADKRRFGWKVIQKEKMGLIQRLHVQMFGIIY